MLGSLVQLNFLTSRPSLSYLLCPTMSIFVRLYPFLSNLRIEPVTRAAFRAVYSSMGHLGHCEYQAKPQYISIFNENTKMQISGNWAVFKPISIIDRDVSKKILHHFLFRYVLYKSFKHTWSLPQHYAFIIKTFYYFCSNLYYAILI